MSWAAEVDWGSVIAALALLFSIYATSRTFKLTEQQNSLIEDQKRLNRLLLAKEEGAAVSGQRADLSANLVRIGNQCKLKVFNKGNAAARNVNVELPDGDSILIASEVESKLPLELLEPHHGFDLHAGIYLGMRKTKFTVRLTWEDPFSASNEKLVYPTL